MQTLKTQTPPEFITAAQTLAENLAASEPIVQYRQAKTGLEHDTPAQELLDKLSTTQAGLRNRQLRNAVRQLDIDQLRSLQSEAQANPVILEFAETQHGAVAYLRDINQQISQLIGLDFASLARRSSCC